MQCEVCLNDYDKSFQIIMNNETHIFDSFECAIKALAPACIKCNCKIIGHGLESHGKFYCCAHCAQQDGRSNLQDRE